MAGDATTLIGVRDAFAKLLSSIAGLKVYDHAPKAFDRLPAVELLLPFVFRVEPEERESGLGSDDWQLEWPFALHVDVSTPERGQLEALQLVGQIIGKVDANPTLDTVTNPVLDAKIVTAEGGFVVRDDGGQPLNPPKLVYELELHAKKLVS